jgi:hypothetical protein
MIRLIIRILAITMVIFVAELLVMYYRLPKCPEPLKVTILDSGGADLKVTSTVEGKGRTCR